jgi:hypothetical protein
MKKKINKKKGRVKKNRRMVAFFLAEEKQINN